MVTYLVTNLVTPQIPYYISYFRLFKGRCNQCNQKIIKLKNRKKTSVKLIIGKVGYTNLGYIEKSLVFPRFFGVTNDLQLGYIDSKSNKIRKKHLKKFNRVQSNCNGGAIMTTEQKNTLIRAINHFGVEHQIDKAIEEMGELITALARRRLDRSRKEDIAEEIADVLIVANQLRIIYGGELVDGLIDQKLSRLEATINGDWRR